MFRQCSAECNAALDGRISPCCDGVSEPTPSPSGRGSGWGQQGVPSRWASPRPFSQGESGREASPGTTTQNADAHP
jgi:hypothetical protein